MIKIRRGLSIPIAGAPVQEISYGAAVGSVALLGGDYVGMKPTLLVREGDAVRLGQQLFEDKKNAGVFFTAPGAGRVAAINRGAKRRFLSLVIELDGEDQQEFAVRDIGALTEEQVRGDLVASGLWTALRTRPFSKIPAPDSTPNSVFVTAMDSNPLAADPALVIAENQDDFVFGLHALTRLTDGQVFVCYRDGGDVPGRNVPNVSLEAFAGPHPSGLAGTHIHHLDPVGGNKVVWYLGYQDVIAIGSLITTGRLKTDRVISLAGPCVKQPRLIRTRLGACIDELTADQLEAEPTMRVISGSVLAGHKSKVPCNYLGRYHQQISVLPEGDHREFLGWQKPGFNTFSASRTFARSLVPGGGLLKLNTSLGGSRRAMVPIGAYEKVMPMDMLPTQLLRALIVGDTEQAQLLGCLELDEEDLALCTFVCPSKYEYGPLLRENLKKIEVEG